MPIITILPDIKEILPQIQLTVIEATVNVAPGLAEQTSWIQEQLESMRGLLTPESIRQTASVKATKEAYRALGKDPNRYRPAAESLMRRIANGKGLYQISNVVDVLNYVSIKTGFSICGYDAELIHGDISLGIGEANEPYQGIGRGELNIERLPVFGDELGAFGTPTSDSTRTMISDKTTRILFVFIGFDAKTELEKTLNETCDLLVKYADAKEIKTYFV